MKALIALFVVAMAISYVLGGFMYSQTVYVYEENIMNAPKMFLEPYSLDIENNPNMTYAKVVVPAVDQDGNGVSTILEVQVVPGSGKALVNIDKLLFWVDTQNSMRTARSVAENVMGINLSSTDIVYTITANASVVEGPSAGAALTVATIAALQGKDTNQDVMMTGTINHDGSIGPIGGVLEKAKAAKSIGADIFLVPAGQSIEIKYEQQRHCEQIGFADYCTIETIPLKTDVSSEAGITIEEVGNINDALNYFLLEE
jgi:uncharacterized protein